MANDLVTQGRRDVAVAGNPWADAARDIETGTYLKFNGNDGRYSYGQDDEDLPAGSTVIADMNILAFGWTCWVDSNVEEELYVCIHDGRPPLEHQLTDYGPYRDDDGWRESAKLSLILESYDGDDQDEAVGTPLLWKTSTGGQVRQIKKLSGAYGRTFSQHPGEYPVIELGAESYAPKNKKHGKVKWSPTLKIVGWVTEKELAAITDGNGFGGGDDGYDDEPAEETARGRGRKDDAEDKPARGRGRGRDEEEQEEAPARGRRGRNDDAEEQEEAPARGRGRRGRDAEEEQEEERPARGRRGRDAEEEQEEAPARGRGRGRNADADDEGDEGEAPAPRGRTRGRPRDEEKEEAPARGRRGRNDDADDEGDEGEAPAPRGRSAGRGGNNRLRNFD